MFAAAGFCFAAMLSGCASTGGDAVADEPVDLSYGGLMPGSIVNWIEVGGGFDSAYMNIAVARGPDYTIFFDPEWAEYAMEGEDVSAAYGVEFSGAVYFTCDEDMPSAADREAMASLKDMEKGDVVVLPDLGLQIDVGKESQSNINGLGDITLRDYNIHWNEEEGAETEYVSVAEEFDFTVKVTWSEGPPSVVAGVSLTEAAKPLSLRHASSLGTCATLIE